MPIAAGVSVLQTQIKNALSLGKAAQIETTAMILSTAIAGVVPMGLFPPAPTPMPLVPSGLSAGQNLIKSSLSLGKGASIDTTAQMMAAGISMIVPTVPPVGLSVLQTQIKNALSLGKAANIDVLSIQLASAIIQYYIMGGVL